MRRHEIVKQRIFWPNANTDINFGEMAFEDWGSRLVGSEPPRFHLGPDMCHYR